MGALQGAQKRSRNLPGIHTLVAQLESEAGEGEGADEATAGNSAGTGARIALLSAKSREEIEGVVRRIEKIETAVESNFQPYFVEAMAFPNSKDCFSKIFEVIAPPEPKPTAPVSRSRRSRRSVGQIENS